MDIEQLKLNMLFKASQEVKAEQAKKLRQESEDLIRVYLRQESEDLYMAMNLKPETVEAMNKERAKDPQKWEGRDFDLLAEVEKHLK